MGLQLILSDATQGGDYMDGIGIYDVVWTNTKDAWDQIVMFCCRALWRGGALLSLWHALADAQGSPLCEVNNVTNTVPATGAGISLQSFSYCGGVLDLTAFVENYNYDKTVTLYYTDGSNRSTPRSVLGLSYSSAVDSTNGAWEYWNINTAVYLDGLTELLNLTYVDDDNGQTYFQNLDIAVVASGAAIPTPAILSPYAQPTGLSDDITDWLAVTADSQIAKCKTMMLANINSPGAANGTVVASTSTENPDYHYNWVRDAALTMNVVGTLYAAASSEISKAGYEEILFQYAQARATEQNDPDLETGLGEPKFELNNSIFTGPWGRPQNDGPAESAATLMGFANAYLENGGDMDTVISKIWDSNSYPNSAPVLKDLMYVATNWSSSSFDLWEEEEGYHFFNRIVSHRALTMGSQFAINVNDSDTANTLSAAADDIVASLPAFWDASRLLILYESGDVLHNKSSYKDIAVILGVLHGTVDGGPYTFSDDRLLVSAFQIATSFLSVYPIANVTTDSAGGTLGIPVGRYPEDIYNGIGTSPNGGNPWYLATAAMAELLYSASSEFQSSGSIAVSNISLPFWSYFAPTASLAIGQTYSNDSAEFGVALSSLEGWADAFIRRIRYHTPADQRLSEEYNRETGDSTGALDLTWSYASLLTASFARAQLKNDTGYITSIADL